MFDVNSTNVSAYSRESIAGASLIERLTTRMNASSNGAWAFGIGKFIIVDGGSGVYLDVANRDARFIRSDEDSGRHFDFVVLTDSNTLARIMSGQTGMSEAVRDGCFSIHPADSIPVSDYQQLFLELTSIVTGGDKVRKYEPMSAMMIANTPEKTDRLHS